MLKDLPAKLRDRIVSRHRSGESYKKKSAALKVPKRTMASIILPWKKSGKYRSWVDKPLEGQSSLQHPTDLGFMTDCPEGSFSSEKNT